MNILELLNELRSHYDWQNIKTDISNRYLQAKYLELNTEKTVKPEQEDVYKPFSINEKLNLGVYKTTLLKFEKTLKEFEKNRKLYNEFLNNINNLGNNAEFYPMLPNNRQTSNKPDNNKPNRNYKKIGLGVGAAALTGAALYFSKDIYEGISQTYKSISESVITNTKAGESAAIINENIIKAESEAIEFNKKESENFKKEYDNFNKVSDEKSKEILKVSSEHNEKINESNKKLEEFSKVSNDKVINEQIKKINDPKYITDQILDNKKTLEESLHEEFKKKGIVSDIQNISTKSALKSVNTFDSYYAPKYDNLRFKYKKNDFDKVKRDNVYVDFTQLINPTNTGVFSGLVTLPSGDMGGLNQNNINFTIANLNQAGISNKYVQTSIIAKMYMETGYKSLVENSYITTDNKRLRALFNRLSGISDEQLTAIKNAGDSEFYDLIYGDMYAHNKGLGLGNTQKGDAYKYRGRGFVGITGKNMYRIIGGIIGVDLISKPELLEDPEIAMKASIAYIMYMAKVNKVDMSGVTNQQQADEFIFQAIGGKKILNSQFGRESMAKMHQISQKILSEYNLSGGAYNTPGTNVNSTLPNTISSILPVSFMPEVYLGKPGLNYIVENNKIYYVGANYKLANKNLEYAINATTQLNGALLRYIHTAFPNVNVSSSWRTQAILGDGTKTDLHQFGAAVDIDYGAGVSANENKIAKLLFSSGFMPHMTELIYSRDGAIHPNGTDGFINIKKGNYFNYSPSTMQMHHNHIHAAWVPNHDISGWYNSAKSMQNNPPVIMLSDGNWYTRLSNGITKVKAPSQKALSILFASAESDRNKAMQELKIKEQEVNKPNKIEVSRNKSFNENKAKSNFRPKL